MGVGASTVWSGAGPAYVHRIVHGTIIPSKVSMRSASCWIAPTQRASIEKVSNTSCSLPSGWVIFDTDSGVTRSMFWALKPRLKWRVGASGNGRSKLISLRSLISARASPVADYVFLPAFVGTVKFQPPCSAEAKIRCRRNC